MLGRYQMQTLLDPTADGDLPSMFDRQWESTVAALRVAAE
jgi:hypothetical protein